MAVGLIMSRLVLQALGADDYGLYNVVGGVIALFAFISGSLASTTTRFLNYEIGKVDGNPNRIFNICYVMHIMLGLLIFFCVEILGVWYINNFLNIDVAKIDDALFVFHVSLLATCVGIVNIPYQSLFIVHEKFFFIAINDILCSIFKLFVAFSMILYDGNILRLYALGISAITMLSFLIYHFYGKKNWQRITSWKYEKNFQYYKEVLFFNNYNILATGALVARAQGSNLVINFFFGTLVNAAYAIANVVLNFVNSFIGNFDTASAPQIIQSAGLGDIETSSVLASKVCRICILLMEIIFFPLIIEIDWILQLWLGQTPMNTTLFCELILVLALVSSTSGGIVQLINAVGKVRWFHTTASILLLSSIPFSIILYQHGMPAYTILLLFILTDIINRIVQLVLLKKIAHINILLFVKDAYIRPMLVLFIVLPVVLIYKQFQYEEVLYKFLGILSITTITLFVVFFIGINCSERTKVKSLIMKIITNKN